MWKKLTLSAVIVIVCMLGTSVVLAGGGDIPPRPPGLPDNVVYSEEEEIWVPAITDGRLNAFDLCCPIAVYYARDDALVWNKQLDEEGEEVWVQEMAEVITGIDVWTVDSLGVGQLALRVPMSQIVEAFASTEDVVFAEGNGIQLGYSVDSDYFWVTYGKYSNKWEAFEH